MRVASLRIVRRCSRIIPRDRGACAEDAIGSRLERGELVFDVTGESRFRGFKDRQSIHARSDRPLAALGRARRVRSATPDRRS